MKFLRPRAALAMFTLALIHDSWAQTPAAPGQRLGPELHSPAPDLHLASYVSAPAGSPTSLADLRGKVVVLEFWATWCLPCIAAIPHLNELTEKLADQPVVFIAVSRDDPDPLAKFLEKHPMKTWVALESEGRPTSRAYGVGYIPHTVVIDKEGAVAAITQPTALTEAALRDVLAGKPVDLPRKVDVPADPEWDRALGALEEGNPAAIAHAILQHSDATGMVTHRKPNTGRIRGDGLPWQTLLHLAYDAEPSQLAREDIPALNDQLFRVSVQAANNDDAAARAMLRDLLASALGLKAEWKQEDREVLVLTRKAGAPAPKPTDAQAGGGFTRHGRIALSKVSMQQLAGYLGAYSGNMIGIDETRLDGEYDVKLTWTADDEASLVTALDAYGLVIRKETRAVPILHPRVEAPAKVTK